MLKIKTPDILSARENAFPTDVSADRFYSERNTRYLKNMERDIQEGKAYFAEHDLIEATE